MKRYQEFTTLELHPYYFLFFKQAILGKGDGVVSFTSDGFRGLGPEKRNDRKLAFLLGGSTAFGYGATNDNSTITSYLNSLQDEYFFVNAAVPTWNSMQELYRLNMDLPTYKPDLVIVLNGFNDAILTHFNKSYSQYFPNMIKHFPQLKKTFEPGQWQEMKAAPSKSKYILTAEDEKRIEAALTQYLRNVASMHAIAKGYGFKIKVFAQPVFFMHKNIINADVKILDRDWEETAYIKDFYRLLFSKANEQGISIVDLSALFDADYVRIPLNEIFLDQVHISDLGNKRVAIEMLKHLKNDGM